MPDPEHSGAKVTLWRAFVPRWAFAPLSGEGAARFAGRWNPVGEPTLYAARELSTAWAEYNQGFVQHPALIVEMVLTGARLADVTTDRLLAEYGLDDAIHRCEWRSDLDDCIEPATHKLRKRLLKDGFHGIVYPSFMSRGGTCVALWHWNRSGAPTLEVTDPEGRLPKTAASWL